MAIPVPFRTVPGAAVVTRTPFRHSPGSGGMVLPPAAGGAGVEPANGPTERRDQGADFRPRKGQPNTCTANSTNRPHKE